MITLHHLENSRSLRIVWLLEELGLDYEIRHYARDSKTMLAPAELKQVHRWSRGTEQEEERKERREGDD